MSNTNVHANFVKQSMLKNINFLSGRLSQISKIKKGTA